MSKTDNCLEIFTQALALNLKQKCVRYTANLKWCHPYGYNITTAHNVTAHQALWVLTHPVVAPVSCRHQNWWVRASLDTRVLALPEARHLKTGQNSCNCPTLIQSTVNTATVSSDDMNMSGCTRSIRCFYEVNFFSLQSFLLEQSFYVISCVDVC